MDIRKHQPKRRTPSGDIKRSDENTETWKTQEKRVAKRTGGTRTRGSGCGCNIEEKGDIKIQNIRCECKSTKHQSISIKVKQLAKITSEANAIGKIPGLAITFKDVPAGVDDDWILLPLGCIENLEITQVPEK